MIDFITFQTIVAPTIFILVYWVGAIVFPIAIWFGRGYLIKKFSLFATIHRFITSSYHSSPDRVQVASKAIFIISIICMELCWRVMFEFIITYFQMREYLQILSTTH